MCLCAWVCVMVAVLTAAMRQGEWRGNIPYREREGGREGGEEEGGGGVEGTGSDEAK